jgi:hypothetical protein
MIMHTQIIMRCDHCGGTITMTLKSDDHGDEVTYRCAGCGCVWEFGFVLVCRGAHCPVQGTEALSRLADSELVDCPQCGGTGTIAPGATCGMWAGLVSWPDNVQAETCDLCDGDGQVTAEVAARYMES